MEDEIQDQIPNNLNNINDNPQENNILKENILLNNENPPSNNEKNEDLNSSKKEQEEIPKVQTPCIFCQTNFNNSNNYIFSNCNHQICSLCLFRRIFVRNLIDIGNLSNENIEIKCQCEKGSLQKNIEELFEINNKKNLILTEHKTDEQNNLDNQNNLCENHSKNYTNIYCITCSKNICDICLSESHNNHHIISNSHLLKSLKKDLKQIPLKYKNKEDFEINLNDICNKIKKITQNNLDEIMTQIDIISTKLNEFKISIQEKYTYELTKTVKILKLYKLFFLDYYYEKKEAETTNNININILRYVNSIQYELKDVQININEKLLIKLNEIKSQIENLSLNENEEEENLFNQKFDFEKVVNKFQIENFHIKAHEKLINGLFQINDDKLISGGFDFSMKIWSTDENGMENTQTIKGRCGAVYSMVKLDNKKFFISAANNSNINLCEYDDEKNTINITQSLTSHTKSVITMEILDDGKLISGGADNTIIIWEKDFNGNYIQIQEIKENLPIMKIIKLKNNKLAFTTNDGIIRILFEKKTIINNEINKKFTVLCKLTKHNGRVISMCEMSNGFLLSGGADLGRRKDNDILVWKPNDFDGYFYSLTISGHKSDVNSIIQLMDGRIASSSKDRSIRIWKCVNQGKDVNFEIEEILEDYPHGLYCLIQLNDGRLCSSTSDNSLVLWRSGNVFSYY